MQITSLQRSIHNFIILPKIFHPPAQSLTSPPVMLVLNHIKTGP